LGEAWADVVKMGAREADQVSTDQVSTEKAKPEEWVCLRGGERSPRLSHNKLRLKPLPLGDLGAVMIKVGLKIGLKIGLLVTL
jgi:hypothetical protein